MASNQIQDRQFIPERLIPGLIFFIVAVSLWLGFQFAFGQIGQAVVEQKAISINRTLALGSTGDDVAAWQEFLVAENKGLAAQALKAAFARGVKKGHFGGLTGKATEEWQKANGIIATYPAVGPKTRTKYAERISAKRPATVSPASSLVELVAPNGGETLQLGGTYDVRWRFGSPQVPATHVTLTLEDRAGSAVGVITTIGPAAGAVVVTTPATNPEYRWKLEALMVEGDLIVPLKPGTYRMRIDAYDGPPCPGFCSVNYPQPKLLASDRSDAAFNIVPSPIAVPPLPSY